MRLVYAGRDTSPIHGLECPQIDDLGINTMFLRQLLCCLQRPMHADVVGKNADIFTGPHHFHPFQRGEELRIRYLALEVVHTFVLNDHHRIIATHGAFQQAVGVARRCRGHHPQAGNTHEDFLHARRMLGTQLMCRAARHPHHKGTADTTTGHVMDFRGVVHELIHGEPGEIDAHNFDDGTGPDHGRTDTDARVAVFGDGGIDYPLLAVLGEETAGRLVGAASDANILTHGKDQRVPRHFLIVGAQNTLPIHHFSHGCLPPSVYT